MICVNNNNDNDGIFANIIAMYLPINDDDDDDDDDDSDSDDIITSIYDKSLLELVLVLVLAV